MQDDALAARRGLWGGGEPVAPWDWRKSAAQRKRVAPSQSADALLSALEQAQRSVGVVGGA